MSRRFLDASSVSLAEREAVTPSERTYWSAARARASGLRQAVEHLNKYLLGEPADLAWINNMMIEARATYEAVHAALAIRKSRHETEEMNRNRAKQARKRAKNALRTHKPK